MPLPFWRWPSFFPPSRPRPGIAGESTVELDYIELAALGRLRLPLAADRAFINVLTGPAVALEAACVVSASIDQGPSNAAFEEERACDESQFQRSSADIGWAVGGGLEVGLTENLSASAAMLYAHGLVDVDAANNSAYRSRTVTLQAGLSYAIR